jgi:hypothetical protein
MDRGRSGRRAKMLIVGMVTVWLPVLLYLLYKAQSNTTQ